MYVAPASNNRELTTETTTTQTKEHVGTIWISRRLHGNKISYVKRNKSWHLLVLQQVSATIYGSEFWSQVTRNVYEKPIVWLSSWLVFWKLLTLHVRINLSYWHYSNQNVFHFSRLRNNKTHHIILASF